MSPGMVEVRNPRNPGQIFFPPSYDQQQENPNPNLGNKVQNFTPLFDQNPIFIDPQQENPSPMIKNMSQPSNKPSLSKVRLLKSRKKVVCRKPQSIPNAEKIEERINRWNPFVPEPGVRVSESSSANANTGAFGFGGTNFDAGKIVFGSGGPNLSRNPSHRSAGSFDSVNSKGVQFVFGSGVEKNDGSSRESSLGSDEGMLFSEIPNEIQKMDLKSTGSGDDFEKKKKIENGFVFDGSVNGGNFDVGYAVFGSEVMKSINLSWNSSIGSEEGLFPKLPDEMRKLNLKNSGNVNDSEKKQAENGFVFWDSMNVPGMTSSVSGSQPINVGLEKPNMHSVSFGSERSGNSDEGFFMFGSGTNNSVGASGLENGSFSKLPDEMRKLNLKNNGNLYDFKKNKQAENVFAFGDIKTGPRSTGSVSASQPINGGSEKSITHPVNFSSEGNGNSDEGVFIFGNGTNNNVDASGMETGSFSKLPDEMRKLNLKNNGNVDDFKKDKHGENVFVFGDGKTCSSSTSSIYGSQPISVGFEKPNTCSVNFGSVGSGNSDDGVFVVGSGTNNNVDANGLEKGSFSKLPDKMRKLNLKNTGNFDDFKKNKQGQNVFVFGDIKTGSRSTGPVSASQPINGGSEKSNTLSVSFGSEGNENSYEGVFIFGSGANNSVDASILEKGSFSKLPDETRKLNLKNNGNVDDFKKDKHAENVFVFGDGKTGPSSTGFVSASQPMDVGFEKPNTRSVRFGSGGSGNSDEGVFVFGSGMNNSADASGLEKGSFSNLPDEMRKLNLKNSGSVDDFEKNKQGENVFIFLASKTSSGSSSGSNVNKIPESAEFASFDGGSSGSKLMNIGLNKPSVISLSFGSGGSRNSDASAFVFGSGGKRIVDISGDTSLGSDDALHFNLPDEMRKMNLTGRDGFEMLKTAATGIRLGGERDVTGSFPFGVANNVPEETGKLDVGRKTTTQSMTNETVGSAASPFVFVSSTENSFVSGFDNGTTFNLPIGKQFSTQGLEKDKKMADREKVHGGNCFIFGTSENRSAYLGGISSKSTLHNEMGKRDIGTNTEKSVENVPFEFSFQGVKQNDRTNITSIPSSPAPNFQSTGPTLSFTGKPLGLETPHMEFKTPKQYAIPLTKETLFSRTYQNMPFSAKKSDARKTRMMKKMGKTRPLGPVSQNFPTQFVSEESYPPANTEVDCSGGYSPMDYSPYHEEFVANQYSREPSVASEDSINFFSHSASTVAQKSVSVDEQEEVLVSEAQRWNISEGKCQEVGDNGSKDRVTRNPNAESVFLDKQTDKFEKGSDMSKHENMDLYSDARTYPMDAKAGLFSSDTERPDIEAGSKFTFSSSLGDLGESNYKFAASPSVRGPIPAAKHTYRRKNRLKSVQNPSDSITNTRISLTSPFPDSIPHISTSGLPDSVGQKNTLSAPRSENERKTGKSKESNARQEPASSAADSVPLQEACEKWRFRGNQAYANGHLIKADDYYTRGVNSVSLKEIPSSCIKPLSLCYSNRAATRMSLGKWREALNDCKMAVLLDPDFLKARVRVANCHLALGEIGEALNHFRKCLQSEKDIRSDQKYIVEASNGLQKAQRVADLTGQSAELLLRRTSNDASKALNMITEALLESPHSEILLEMKAEALLVMRNYEDVIKLCEQTLDFAEQNSVVTESECQFENIHSSEFVESSSPRLWRWHLIAKSYFYLGKLEEALELLQKHEETKPAMDKSSEASISFAVMVHKLLRLKSAGNEAFQTARHSEAVEYYSSALVCNAESRPFAAVCFCNRAAAYQALGQITDAIADCSLAIALYPTYAKAISRRATLHELIRDYGQAANDLNRLISLLQRQMQEKDNDLRGVERSSSNITDLKRARARLAEVEEEAQKGLSLNMYMILGIEPSSSSADVKKAYRKAALRHHPDKAGQFLVRNENVDDALWREVAAEVHADADRLFKMIGEAYTTLSDPTKRLQYDEEEEMRTCPIRGYNVASPKTSSHYTYSSHHDKSFNRHHWQSYGSSNRRW